MLLVWVGNWSIKTNLLRLYLKFNFVSGPSFKQAGIESNIAVGLKSLNSNNKCRLFLGLLGFFCTVFL